MSIFKKIWHKVKHAATGLTKAVTGESENQRLADLDHGKVDSQ